MRIREIMESAGRVVTLWHGGRDLQYSYKELRSHKNGSWEHGPGLYLTTHYSTAAKYAKGGGTVYKVTVELGTEMSDVSISKEDVLDFAKNLVIGTKRKEFIADVESGMARRKTGEVSISMIVNLAINLKAVRHADTGELRAFLMKHGVDYALVTRYGGRDETVVVVVNPNIIKKVEPVKAKDVDSSEYEISY